MFLALRQPAPDLALIVLSGLDDLETAMTAVREGAQDYMIKSEIRGSLLKRSVFYAMERTAQEHKIRALAHYDTLTQLSNRTLFFEVANRGIAHMKRAGKQCAVFFIDHDRFKDINDTRGHATGDEVLKDTAARLVKGIREHDIAARFGGDEFVVFLNDLENGQAAWMMAERICQKLNAPRFIAGQAFSATVSIGIAVYPDHGDILQELLKNADAAMYEAKRAGGAMVRSFDPQICAGTAEPAADNILVVDDEPIIGTVFERELRGVGYRVDCVLSGEEALMAVKQKKYGLVFVDQILPGMDGVDACAEINRISPQTALVFMTGVFDKRNILIKHPSRLRDLIGGHKVHYLYKPFASGEIVAVAMAALGLRKEP